MLYNPRYENRRALVVGIDAYKNVSPLSHARKDAEAIAKILLEVFAFAEQDVTLLLDSQAKKNTILAEFHKYTQDKTLPDDKLLIFFAGHGHTISGNRGEVGFLVPVDGKPNDTSTLIRWDELTRNAELIRAKHVLFIMDACYGGLAITRAPSVGSKRFVKDMCQRYSRQVITAGKADERVADGGGPIAGHSIFTGHLIEALKGAAATNEGVITANGLMSYVYEKVGNDPNSHQTPHYGYVEGDGDFIFTEKPLLEISVPSEKDKDVLIDVSSTGIKLLEDKSSARQIKEYVADPSKRIVLHDLAMEQVRKFVHETGESKMPLEAPKLADQEIVERYKRYEICVRDLTELVAIVAHWGRNEERPLLEKIIKRMTDNNGMRGGINRLLDMRWYPTSVVVYAGGISALAAARYENLKVVLTTTVDCRLASSSDRRNVVAPLCEAMGNLHETFKSFPGHEKNLVPRSEYLFKLLQPQLDEILFLGQGYEALFDRFEMFMALACADVMGIGWGPMGRFGYKHGRGRENLYINLMEEAESQKDNWPPIKAGLFRGSYARFEEAAKAISELMAEMSWF